MDREGPVQIKGLNISNNRSCVDGMKAGCELWQRGSASRRLYIILYFLEQVSLEGVPLVYEKDCVLGGIIFRYLVIHLLKMHLSLCVTAEVVLHSEVE